MRTIKTTTGAEIPLDGDLLTVMETLYHEVTARRELERSFEDMAREIAHLVGQMTHEERDTYLQESLFLNSVTYENERLGAYMRKLAGEARSPAFAPDGASSPGDPLHLLLALEHPRHALRRPHRLRLRRSVWQARAGRHAARRRSTTSGPARPSRRCAPT